MILRSLIASLTITLLASCVNSGAGAGAVVNPSFPISEPAARDVIRNIARQHRPLPRPLVIIGGFRDPGIAAPILKHEFAKWTGSGDRIVTVSLAMTFSFDQCRQRIIDAVDQAFPSDDPRQTIEVDVIGFSMGGLAARYAASDVPPEQGEPATRRLRIARLFTISSPLRGAAVAAELPLTLHPLQPPMRPGSRFLRAIDAAPVRPDELYQIFSYVRLGDPYIREANSAINRETAWWVSTPPLSPPHEMAFQDGRILADILCRLLGEPPLTSDPPTPLPNPQQAAAAAAHVPNLE
ncbi:MAG TPA: hypothetical protein VLI90_11725 [Tepidisphaeraceae bacterium]|nr:hypothetical protein [Tepidisphaeraceae bacterium]